MNAWFDRFAAAMPDAGVPAIDRREAELLLRLAAAAAHASGARQFAPLATYLAGRAAAGAALDGRLRLLAAAVSAAEIAGEATGPLEVG